ncbi:tetratricopeptide repeat protein [Hymenobacter chitinivorans]|uniref:Tetratricopeptide repeat protein n=1 Tax=Hymenobacter chitinivorans DSM 11115 TaxID=1121954 RepID=A0A2M9B4Z2_9BACT|nr:tetratricopeptide repeat protein [Hymenobacter chitinivorans]PJJ53009.1 tetratricopeptide repeat protein [Hymenobacter chitinivorans DSM 11115]
MSTLDDLFAQLRVATTPTEIDALQNGIWQLWLMSGDPRLDKEMEAGLRVLAAGDYTAAIRVFTGVLEQQPEFAEAWNKRATAYYLRGEYRASLLDIAQTLQREPRHFGALSGWATILQTMGDYRAALRVLHRLEALCPYLPGLQARLHDLRDQLDENL